MKSNKTKDKYAWTVKVGQKGQIVIPKQARKIFNIETGDSLLLLGDQSKGLGIPPKSTFEELSKIIFGNK